MRRSLTVLAGAVSAVALMPASAAVAGQYTLGGDPAHGGNRLTYSDKAAETNNVTISLAGGEVVLHDAGAPVVQATDPATGLPRGLSCRIIDPQTVGCPLVNAGQAIRFLAVNADVGDDVVTNATDIPSVLNGEQGNDTLNGGSGADTLNGDGGIDTLDGGAGDDVIETDGHDAATGYGGERDIVTCGPGNDTAKIDRKDTVDDVQPPFTANFTPGSPTTCESVVFEGTPVGTTPPPGPPPPPAPPGSGPSPQRPPIAALPSGTKPPATPAGPAIPVGLCKKVFKGTALADNFVGDDTSDRMLGRSGNDVMFGFGGADCIYGERGNDRMDGGTGNDRIAGGPGSDSISGGVGNDRIYGQGGNDQLFGYAGNDRIVGGSGRDRIDGGSGRDVIDSRDRKRDVVRCGSGRDTVRADRVDKLIGCERSTRR